MADSNVNAYARKYRPSTLKDYIGNKKIKDSLVKYLNKDYNSRPQTILLSGASGCGKTTLARIIAKEYSCLDRTPENGACDVCFSCTAFNNYIESGDFEQVSNVKEVNIAEDSSKGKLESVIQDMGTDAFQDEWKIFILDECHMASPTLQNALLKVVEEPAKGVLVIFCTTDPDKLIPTLRNRCLLKYEVTKPTLADLSMLLKRVCNAEGVEYDNSGIEFICQKAELTIRESLSSLEQVVSEQGSATLEAVNKVYDSLATGEISKFLYALLNADTLKYITCIKNIKDRMSLSQFIPELKRFILRGVYIYNGIDVEGVTNSELAGYRKLFADMGVEKTAVLIEKVTKIQASDPEYDLVALGYTGLKSNVAVSSAGSESILGLKNELQAERSNAINELDAIDKKAQEEGAALAVNEFAEINLDDLLRPGASVVS